MNYLDTRDGYELFLGEARKRTYVDKSLMIDELYRYTQDINKYVCVTRPRRFGKTMAANMIAAFFNEATAKESQKLFDGLQIGELRLKQEAAYKEDPGLPLCWPLQGECRVIHINMLDVLNPEVKSYDDFYQEIRTSLLDDLAEAYPRREAHGNVSFDKALKETGDAVVFVIDEWDAVFEESFMAEKDKELYCGLGNED